MPDARPVTPTPGHADACEHYASLTPDGTLVMWCKRHGTREVLTAGERGGESITACIRQLTERVIEGCRR